MQEINKYYSPSINIIRDFNKGLDYIPTPNSKQVYNQIINNFTIGTHSFNIVGNYGTGKSSFLLAFEQHINQKQSFFAELNGSFKGVNGFNFIPIIGDFSSLSVFFANYFGIGKKDFSTQDILNQLESRYKECEKNGKGLFIAIDEFGKFLEYAAKNNPEKELYFIQQLSEYINDNSKNILLVTTLHQGFNTYSWGLSENQRNEWDKVKGRLKEITFNEPVEQLLLLASERISSQNGDLIINKNFDNLFNIIEQSKTFPLNSYFDKNIAKRLLPFDILSASIMTIALQRYGQNERSLFQFIDSNDYLGLSDFDRKNNPYFNISCTYDYLIYNYYSILSTKYNPNYGQWATIRNSIERVEGELGDYAIGGIKVIKALGLLNLFAHGSAIINKEFLIEYSRLSLGLKNAEDIIEKLIQFKIIGGYSQLNKRYRLLEGTDLDIEKEIEEAKIDAISDISFYLNRHFYFPYIQAKEHFYRTGTPRFFNFIISENPQYENHEDSDGLINLIFPSNNILEDVISCSHDLTEPIIYCHYNNTLDIRNLLVEIERMRYVKEQHPHDRIAQRELDSNLLKLKTKLNELVLEKLYTLNEDVTWVFNGKVIDIYSHRSLNQMLSQICDLTYPATPIFKNEMVNKSKLSGAMQPARKNLIKSLVNNYNEYNIGYPDDKFPPDKTIYLSLLKNTGIHKDSTLTCPDDISFKPLWDESMHFLEDAKLSRTNIGVLIGRLQKRPFRLKQGFIDFWIPIFLFITRDDYALFDEDGYIPTIDEETLFLISKHPYSFEIKSFDISGIKLDLFNSYREFLNIENSDVITNDSFIELVKPFISFYRQLPEYNKKTKRISKKAIALREAIVLSKEPEKTFFEDFPRAIDISLEKIAKDSNLVRDYIDTLQSLVREIRTAYEELINRIENFILSDIIGEKLSFPDYKGKLQDRYKKLKIHMLLPNQKVFYQRLMSELDIRNAWIASIGQTVIGKSLETISDEEEIILFEKFKDIINELDNLCTLAESDINLDKEEVFKFEITSFIKGLQKHTLRLPKTKMEELKPLEINIKSILNNNNKTTNIALLLKLLQDEINE